MTIDLNMNRAGLAQLFAELGFTEGAEIGVEKGVFSEILCQANPQLTLYSIDPWKAYREYRDHTTQEKIDEIYNEAVNRLKNYNCKIIRKFSEEAYKDFADVSLDFVYIDANHDAKHTWQDLTLWVPKVKPGGIVSGHDFVRYKGDYGLVNQVKDTVLKFTGENNISPLFALRDANERTSWMWVKR